MAGYSGTPLVKKLGIKAGTRIFLANAPKEYLNLVTPLPKGVSTEKLHLTKTLRAVIPKLKQDGMVWVSHIPLLHLTWMKARYPAPTNWT
jgi:hypothetical protein